jgi:hypothetical protein
VTCSRRVAGADRRVSGAVGVCYNVRMRGDPTFSFMYDRASAAQAFQRIGIDGLVLAILAGVPPEAEWEGCRVYEGPSPGDPETTVCIGIRGPGAATVHERLVEAFERNAITVRQVYEGGPPVRRDIARVDNGTWAAP